MSKQPRAKTAIPKSVRDLLGNTWELPNGYSAHESVFEDPEERDGGRWGPVAKFLGFTAR